MQPTAFIPNSSLYLKTFGRSHTKTKGTTHLWLIVAAYLLTACGGNNQPKEAANTTLFKQLSAAETGIDFSNDLSYNRRFNIYTYRNFYNGGGVAVGDINNDGLMDLFFTGNMVDNRLYLNKGNMQFEDITHSAGVAGTAAWSTGVSMADINGDGLVDIYVCNSGDVAGDNKQNELFINNGDNTFSESAEAFGLADKGFSTHIAFFDYDLDGDLDAYMLNNSYQAIGSFNLKKNERPIRNDLGGDKLYRNDNGQFVDVSEEAGIFGSVIGFGLGVTVGDANKDGWMDIFVSNDFFERDYLYLNNQDGTFKEVLTEQMRSISAASMGADMADINNNGYPDIFVTEMLPEKHERIKTVTTFESWDRYQYKLQNDYYHQFTRNMLHLNNANGTFSEVGRLAGVHATDWSWGALIADLDRDGLRDIFVANGIYQDLTDQDYLQFASSDEVKKAITSGDSVNYQSLIESIPSVPLANYAFQNQNGLQFHDRAADWGLAQPGHSNGAVYADLDNDGDLDLVVNNVNMPAFVYQNQSAQLHPENHYLQFLLKGETPNTQAIGAKITAKANGQTFYAEQMPMRGFQSTVDPRPFIGLGAVATIDTLSIIWPDHSETVLYNLSADTLLTLHQKEATQKWVPSPPKAARFFAEKPLPKGLETPHKENHFVDFDRDRLTFHQRSTEGPRIAKADVNNDGLEDLYICGAKDSPGRLLLQMPDGSFKPTNEALLSKDQISEDTDACFFDANGNGYPDLYVCSGGNDFPSTSSALIDRLYINDGKGNFSKSEQVLPSFSYQSTTAVCAADVNANGHLDLFVGVRLKPFMLGVTSSSFLLMNDGQGKFTDKTKKLAPALAEAGMVCDAVWTDFDNDGDPDLIVVGEYMPIRIYENIGGQLREITESAGLMQSNGWWNRLIPADFDGDGDMDFIVANHGLNSRFKATEAKPVQMYINDFDQNGMIEQIITQYFGDTAYPMPLKHDLVMQMPGLKKQYLKYDSYKDQQITDIFPEEVLSRSVVKQAFQLQNCLLENKGDGTFTVHPLPIEAQFSSMYALLVDDFNADGHPDVLMAGNLYDVKPEVGRYDADYGTLLLGDGKLNFKAIRSKDSGFLVNGQARDLVKIENASGEPTILLIRNNDTPQAFTPLGLTQAKAQ